MKRNIGILIFDDAEVLDFAGPFEVFSVTAEINDFEYFEVFTVAKTKQSITAVNGLSVNPKYSFDDAPQIDILIISGGDGTNKLITDSEVLQWVEKIQSSSEYTMSICSGARVLAKIGCLDNLPFATHHLVYENVLKLAPTGRPDKKARFVDSGHILTSGGISAGIDLSFYMVKKLLGTEIMRNTANYMEYNVNLKSHE